MKTEIHNCYIFVENSEINVCGNMISTWDMKKAIWVTSGLLSLFSLANTSCDGLDEHYSTNPNHRLSFSVDILSFDTVFTTIGSATKQFMVYNPNKEALNIQSIMLASGGESGFRLNVDGRKGDYFGDVGILAEDSMFVFVEVNVNPNNSDQPLLVEDSIVFMTNGGMQAVRLEAYGQNMHLHKGGVHITKDTTYTADLPHLVYDSIMVAEGATLRLAEGTTLYMHDKANIVVSGRLMAEGSMENPVVIRGDRLDFVLENILPYDRTPGQWGGIFFKPGSFGSRLEHTIVRNGTNGITVEPSEPGNTKLEISNSQLTNMKGNVLTAINSKLVVTNTEISNAGGTVVALAGGDYRFIHCSLINYMRLVQRSTECLVMANAYKQNDAHLPENNVVPLNARFDNCLIDGSFGAGKNPLSGEIALSSVDEAGFDYYFNHCVLTTVGNDDGRFESTLFTTEDNYPVYRKTGGEANKYQFDFRPDTVISLGVGKADPAISAHYPVDRLGVNRSESKNGPTIGAYEFAE